MVPPTLAKAYLEKHGLEVWEDAAAWQRRAWHGRWGCALTACALCSCIYDLCVRGCLQVEWDGDVETRLKVVLPEGPERDYFKQIVAEEEAQMEEEDEEELGEEGGQWPRAQGRHGRARCTGQAGGGGRGVAGRRRSQRG